MKKIYLLLTDFLYPENEEIEYFCLNFYELIDYMCDIEKNYYTHIVDKSSIKIDERKKEIKFNYKDAYDEESSDKYNYLELTRYSKKSAVTD